MPGTAAAAIGSVVGGIGAAGSAAAGLASAAAPFIGPAGTIIKGITGMGAAGNTAGAGQQAAADANAFNQQVYGAAQGNLNPFILSGQSANNELGGLLGLNGNTNAQNAFDTFRKSSPYQFQLNQGLNAIATQNAGQYGSGATAKALNNYAQGQAGSALGNYMAQLGFLNNSGQTAAGTLAGLGNDASRQYASNLYNGANAYGAGQVNSANAQNSMTNGLTGALSSFLNPASTSSYGNVKLPDMNAVTPYEAPTGVLANMPNFNNLNLSNTLPNVLPRVSGGVLGEDGSMIPFTDGGTPAGAAPPTLGL